MRVLGHDIWTNILQISGCCICVFVMMICSVLYRTNERRRKRLRRILEDDELEESTILKQKLERVLYHIPTDFTCYFDRNFKVWLQLLKYNYGTKKNGFYACMKAG